MSKHRQTTTGIKSYFAGMFSFMILSWSVVFIPEIVYDVIPTRLRKSVALSATPYLLA